MQHALDTHQHRGRYKDKGSCEAYKKKSEQKREQPQEIDEALVQHTHTNPSEELCQRKALIHRPAAAMSP